MWETLFWICLIQSDPIRPLETLTTLNAAKARAVETQQSRTREQTRQEFEQKYNQLVNALESFTKEYNGAQGHVWPIGKAKAVRKAFRELEQTNTWRQRDK